MASAALAPAGAVLGDAEATGTIVNMRAVRCCLRACLLAFTRALCRLTSTLQLPRAGPLRTSSNRGGSGARRGNTRSVRWTNGCEARGAR